MERDRYLNHIDKWALWHTDKELSNERNYPHE